MEDKQTKTDRINEVPKSIGLRINEKKTNVMIIEKEENENVTVELNGNKLNDVDNFIYLGSKISNDGDIMVEVNNRISKAANSWQLTTTQEDKIE